MILGAILVCFSYALFDSFTWVLDVSCSYVSMVAPSISTVFSKLLSVVKAAPQARPKTT